MGTAASFLSLVFLIGISLSVSLPSKAFAQTKNQTSYVSSADSELDLKQIAVAPMNDNLSGIYAKPLTEELSQILKDDPQWGFAEANFPARFERLEDTPAEIKKIMTSANAEGVFTGRISKGPAGLTLRMTLYVGPSGLPLMSEEATEPVRFETDRMKTVLHETYQKMKMKMPYRGRVLSRRGQEVTFNLGKKSGLNDGDEVVALQILKVQRHPKLKFMVGTEKEILGKIKIFKADDELSFGNITFEKEAGLIVPGIKVLPDENVKYPIPFKDSKDQTLQDLANRKDANAAFGEKPVEWLPEQPPQYGRVQILAGVGQYAETVGFQNSGSTSGTSTLNPNLGIFAEGWLNHEWFLSMMIRQSTFSVSNSYSGSSPGKINMSTSKYDIMGGRTFLLGEDFMGPKLQLAAGLGKFSSRADRTSPLVFSDMEYGGLLFNFLFNTPVSDQSPWDMGARFKYYWKPSVSESVSSGSVSSVSATDFSFLMAMRVRQNFRYVGEVNFEYYNSGHSGEGDRSAADPVTSISHRLTTLMVGLEYLF